MSNSMQPNVIGCVVTERASLLFGGFICILGFLIRAAGRTVDVLLSASQQLI